MEVLHLHLTVCFLAETPQDMRRESLRSSLNMMKNRSVIVIWNEISEYYGVGVVALFILSIVASTIGHAAFFVDNLTYYFFY